MFLVSTNRNIRSRFSGGCCWTLAILGLFRSYLNWDLVLAAVLFGLLPRPDEFWHRRYALITLVHPLCHFLTSPWEWHEKTSCQYLYATGWREEGGTFVPRTSQRRAAGAFRADGLLKVRFASWAFRALSIFAGPDISQKSWTPWEGPFGGIDQKVWFLA